jgi:voltage-gated potassium channel
MANPLHLLNFRTHHGPRAEHKPVPVPTMPPATDAMFVLLRRMRRPLIVVIVVFSICSAGMSMMPGTDKDGQPYKLTLFDSIYQMAITLTTVGYSEVPYSFSYPQKMWLTLALFLLVISWAYAIGALFGVLQDDAFKTALATQRFERQVKRLREPFFLVAGYGRTGRVVTRRLDDEQQRAVVVDLAQRRIDKAHTDPLSSDLPALAADCRNPAVLGLAGLGSRYCQGVLALTDDDDVNLAVVMSVGLLRPDLPVLARCQDRRVIKRMEHFQPTAVINPNDRYGGYLSLAAHQPVVYQLMTWLMENDKPQLVPERTGLDVGRWVVCGGGDFANEVVSDLKRSGLTVDKLELAAGERVDLGDAVAFVAGTDNDLINIALAERARAANPDVFVAVRQQDGMHRPLLNALDTDSVYIHTDLVAREVLARIVNPSFWHFVELAVQQDDAWAAETRDRLVRWCETDIPVRDVVVLDHRQAPAVVEWLAQEPLTLGDLLRHPDDRDVELAIVTLLIMRGDELLLTPSDDTALVAGDRLLLSGTQAGLDDLSDALFSPAALEYVATGRQVPSTHVWRLLTQRKLMVQSGQSTGS